MVRGIFRVSEDVRPSLVLTTQPHLTVSHHQRVHFCLSSGVKLPLLSVQSTHVLPHFILPTPLPPSTPPSVSLSVRLECPHTFGCLLPLPYSIFLSSLPLPFRLLPPDMERDQYFCHNSGVGSPLQWHRNSSLCAIYSPSKFSGSVRVGPLQRIPSTSGVP